MQGSDHTQRDGIGGRPTRLGAHAAGHADRKHVGAVVAWLATARYASADERVRAKLASRASAVGGPLRDATIASPIRTGLVTGRGLASDDIDVQVHDRAMPRMTDGPRRSTGPIRRRIRRSG